MHTKGRYHLVYVPGSWQQADVIVGLVAPGASFLLTLLLALRPGATSLELDADRREDALGELRYLGFLPDQTRCIKSTIRRILR